jgi:hypothetical protein
MKSYFPAMNEYHTLKTCPVLAHPKPDVLDHHKLCLADIGINFFDSKHDEPRAQTILDISERKIHPHLPLFDPCKTY